MAKYRELSTVGTVNSRFKSTREFFRIGRKPRQWKLGKWPTWWSARFSRQDEPRRARSKNDKKTKIGEQRTGHETRRPNQRVRVATRKSGKND